jgi:hypothetical protein
MDAVLEGVLLTERTSYGETSAERSTRRLAGMTVRRTALRHSCTGSPCLHRNHRRDMQHARFLMTMLELPDELAVDADYDSSLDWVSLSRDEGKLLY